MESSTSTSTAAADRGVQRWGGLAGIAYVALFVAGELVAFGGTPDTSSPPAKIVAYYSDSGHRDKIVLGWALVLLGVFAFIWFLAALRQVLRRLDGDGFLTAVATVGGAVYAALTLAGVSIWTAIATMSDDTFRHAVYPGIIHAGNDTGYVVHAAGGVGVGALMIAASLAAARSGLIPRGAGVVGAVFGVLALGSIFFFPQFLIALWILVAGVLLARRAA